MQVNAAVNVTDFVSQPGVDFLAGTGNVVANNITILAGNDLNFTAANFAVGIGVNPSVFLLAGGNTNVDIQTNQSVFTNASGVFIQGATIALTADAAGTTLQFNDTTPVQFLAGAGGIQAMGTTFLQQTNAMDFTSAGNIGATSIAGGDVVRSTAGSIQIGQSLIANTVTAAMAITAGADLTAFNSVSAGTTIGVTNTLLSPNATAGGNINASHVQVQNINPNIVPPSNTTLTAGNGGITPFVGPGGSGLQHTFNVMTVVSPMGIDFSGSQFPTPSSDGGQLVLNANTQLISSAGIAGANFNGADAPDLSSPAGGGGAFAVNTAGALTVNGVDITATSGIIDTAGAPSGAGGSVSLNSTNGQVSLTNTRVQVSSGDIMGTPNRRSSFSGGNINLSSAAGNGTAILIDNTAQLLALLEDAAPGPGGLITISASGTNSSIQAGGQIQATGGSLTSPPSIDIRHSGDAGQIALMNLNAQADIIKVAALGNNGTLTVGGGVINADNVLKLYAPGSNGQIVFVANCTIGGGTANILAANSVTINNGVTVTTQGHAADVYVGQTSGIPNANYMNFGGNNSTTGTFDGLGATNPQMLGAAPALGPPGGP